MKTNWIKQTLLAGLAVLGLMAGQAVYAQTTSATVDVTAVVPKACRFFTASSSMTIEHSGGLIDPTSGSNATGSTTLNYRCMTGINPLFNIDSDVGGPASPKTVTVVLTDGGTNNMNADITVTATGGAGTPPSADLTHGVESPEGGGNPVRIFRVLFPFVPID